MANLAPLIRTGSKQDGLISAIADWGLLAVSMHKPYCNRGSQKLEIGVKILAVGGSASSLRPSIRLCATITPNIGSEELVSFTLWSILQVRRMHGSSNEMERTVAPQRYEPHPVNRPAFSTDLPLYNH